MENGEVALYEETDIAPFHGMSQERFSKKAEDILRAPIKEEDVMLRPDGLVYLPQTKYRQILFDAFGPGGWALKPEAPPVLNGNRVVYSGSLYCEGRFVAHAIGGHTYHTKSNYDDIVESAKSDCLTRCCKDLGIAANLWDKTFVDGWLEKNAQRVWCEHQTEFKPDGKPKKKLLWRKKTDAPIDSWPWKEPSADMKAKRKQAKQEDEEKNGLDRAIYGYEKAARLKGNQAKFDKLLTDFGVKAWEGLETKKKTELLHLLTTKKDYLASTDEAQHDTQMDALST